MARWLEKTLLLLALGALAAGCKPKIGDDCQISTDCSAAGDRLCDITAPGGYCTIYNCEPDSCPEDESLCVQFGADWSPLPGCSDPQGPSPYARSFCMATCEETADCRDGYQCADLSEPDNLWGALIIDEGRGRRACVVPHVAASVADEEHEGEHEADVCRAKDAPAQGGAGG